MKIKITIALCILNLLIVNTAYAQFDWGNAAGVCSGSGHFNQPIVENGVIEVGAIISGRTGVEIKLTSDRDVDVRLYDKASGTAIVEWPDGLLNEHDRASVSYKDMRVKWSGYKGDCPNFSYETYDYSVCATGTSPGNEYINIDETTREMNMKAFGFQAGNALVEYSWQGTMGCVEGETGPAESGADTFQQPIALDESVVVGELVPGLTDVYIELLSDKDVDIQLFDGNTKIIEWPDGLLNGPERDHVSYGDLRIEWSGYKGDCPNFSYETYDYSQCVNGTSPGNEYISITGTLDRPLTMKAYGFRDGVATVNYSWGGEHFSTAINELGVYAGGTGLGTVYSVDSSGNKDGVVVCSNLLKQPCIINLNNGTIRLLAAANDGSMLADWGGGCREQIGNVCTLNIQNGSFQVSADFELTQPTNDVRTADEIMSNIAFLEIADDAGSTIIRPISGVLASKKYSWIKDAIPLNKAGNYRGMIINAKANKIFAFTGKATTVIQNFAIALEFGVQLYSDGDPIYDNNMSHTEKQVRVQSRIAGASARTLGRVFISPIRAISTMLTIRNWVSPSYWLNYNISQQFDQNVNFINDLADGIEVYIDTIFSDGNFYDFIVISSDRIVETIYVTHPPNSL